jgi:zinc and cadmium transporter
MEAWKIAILFASCFLGGIAVFLFKKDNTQRLKLILSFSGAYLFAITILYLIPEVYLGGDTQIGLYVLAGFLFQILLEQFSEGIEHGHIHKHAQDHYAFPFGIMISLCLHAFIEGIPLAGGAKNQLVFGIALHHIPAAFALGSVLLQNKVSTKAILVLLIVFACMAPAGYFLSDSISKGSIGNVNQYFDRMMGIVIGIFLHISTTILFESSVDHRFNLKKIIAVLAGVAIALMNFLMD